MTLQQIEIIDEASGRDQDLNSWECDFIANLSDIDESVDLTLSQEYELYRIGDKLGVI